MHSKWRAATVIINNNKARTPFSQSRVPSSQAKKLTSGPFCRVGLQEEAQLSRKLREQDNGRPLGRASPRRCLGWGLHFRGQGLGSPPKQPQFPSVISGLITWPKPPPLRPGGPSPGPMCCPRACGSHREGSLGDLHAVMGDAPAEAAGDAPAMLLLLAAHHGLHGVAAHTDGPLWGEQVTGA